MAKKPTDDDAADKPARGERCTVSPNMMKLVTLVTLLIADFDIVFTAFSILTFVLVGGGLCLLFAGVIGFFFILYFVFCIIAARESSKFLERFKSKVKLNEVNA